MPEKKKKISPLDLEGGKKEYIKLEGKENHRHGLTGAFYQTKVLKVWGRRAKEPRPYRVRKGGAS